MVSRLVVKSWPQTFSFNVLEKWTCSSFFAYASKASISLLSFKVSFFRISKASLMWLFAISSAFSLCETTSYSAILDDVDMFWAKKHYKSHYSVKLTERLFVKWHWSLTLLVEAVYLQYAYWLSHSSVTDFFVSLDSWKAMLNSQKGSYTKLNPEFSEFFLCFCYYLFFARSTLTLKLVIAPLNHA